MNAGPTTSPIPLSTFDASVVDAAEAVGLPPEAYTDRAFFDFEVEAAFGHEWMCVGRVDQIPNPGDFFTTTLAGGENVIVDRTSDGRVNVMSSVCQHRGMCVTAPAERPKEEWLSLPPETSGSVRNFRCPYHWWIYDLDGRLLGAPEMHERKDFDRSAISLPQLGVEVWNGFIFANFDVDAPPLAPRMTKLTKILENYHLDEMSSTPPEVLVDVPYNWKIMVENFMEGYHNNRLHHTLYDITLGDAPKDETMLSGVFTEYEPGDGAIAGCGVTAHRDRGLNPTQRALFPPIDTLTDEERWHMVYAYVPPSLLLGVSTDSAFWFLVTPRTPDTFTLQMSYVFPRATTEMKLFSQLLQAHIAGVEFFNGQDLPANIAVQAGMHSRYAPRGPLSRQDIFLVQFNQWLLEKYREAEARVAKTG
jgi:phenylpropionate dioxygenase-like ring-hydroxylating dioxygenase large terminal subunit